MSVVIAVTALPCGLLIGLLLGALGGGGSVLAVPALVYLLGQSPHEATAGALVVVAVGAVTGLVCHARAGRVRWAAGATFGALGTAGSYAGSRWSAALDPKVLMAAFSGLMLVVAAGMLLRGVRGARGSGGPREAGETRETQETQEMSRPRGARMAQGVREAGHRSGAVPLWHRSHRSRRSPGAPGTVPAPAADARVAPTAPVTPVAPGTPAPHATARPLRTAVTASSVGLLTGFFGVGGGFVVVPALTLVLGLEMPVAIGTSLLVILINSAAALATRAGAGSLDWPLLAALAACAAAGSHLGNRLAARLPAQTLTTAFAALVAVLAVTMAATTVPDL
ncbi:TSUP family transporter [Streptomyces sp. YGL11-2]|uniref:TSUP family transporter n=1 Tax=Streptomyces sp. YGL11-2 TaxID=3414028 RepID=UPI003CE8086D